MSVLWSSQSESVPVCRYSSLREVPGYSRFIQERFERCLDLYLCPRQRKMRVRAAGGEGGERGGGREGREGGGGQCVTALGVFCSGASGS